VNRRERRAYERAARRAGFRVEDVPAYPGHDLACGCTTRVVAPVERSPACPSCGAPAMPPDAAGMLMPTSAPPGSLLTLTHWCPSCGGEHDVLVEVVR
jgi:hypothetical protein